MRIGVPTLLAHMLRNFVPAADGCKCRSRLLSKVLLSGVASHHAFKARLLPLDSTACLWHADPKDPESAARPGQELPARPYASSFRVDACASRK